MKDTCIWVRRLYLHIVSPLTQIKYPLPFIMEATVGVMTPPLSFVGPPGSEAVLLTGEMTAAESPPGGARPSVVSEERAASMPQVNSFPF